MHLIYKQKKKKLFEESTLHSWEPYLQKSASTGAPLCRARKHQNILHPPHQNATNERHEILSVRSPNPHRPHHQVRVQPSCLVNTALLLLAIPVFLPRILFFVILILFPLQDTHLFHTNNLHFSSHIHSLRHMPLLFFFALKKKQNQSDAPPPFSSISLSCACRSVLPWLLPFPL